MTVSSNNDYQTFEGWINDDRNLEALLAEAVRLGVLKIVGKTPDGQILYECIGEELAQPPPSFD